MSDHRISVARPGALSRRTVILGAPFLLAACDATVRGGTSPEAALPAADPVFAAMYAALPNERFPIPAVDIRRIDHRLVRQEVAYDSPHPAGTIVVDPGGHYLYLIRGDGRALRYGIGVGREGFGWNGVARIQYKRAWPTWTPPAEMILRQPELEPYRTGMPPGLENPLGARALYLFQNGRDTLYRLHGTNEPYSIGTSVSSGCIRLFNQDIIDLYNRVPDGSRVVVLPSASTGV